METNKIFSVQNEYKLFAIGQPYQLNTEGVIDEILLWTDPESGSIWIKILSKGRVCAKMLAQGWIIYYKTWK